MINLIEKKLNEKLKTIPYKKVTKNVTIPQIKEITRKSTNDLKLRLPTQLLRAVQWWSHPL